jgi:hypothetical protein
MRDGKVPTIVALNKMDLASAKARQTTVGRIGRSQRMGR